MTDRELLELAAKAAGFEYVQWTSGAWTFGDQSECRPESGDIWDPITDDGAAMRLAVKLKFNIEWDFNEVSVNHTAAEFEGNDPYAATRRAIVRAAAEIGKNL